MDQKGTVESGIKYLQGNFISGRTFTDSTDMKRQLTDWTQNYANKRIHGTTRKVPMRVFLTEEKEKLQLLPDNPFAFFNRGVRTVGHNCHIHFANNYYSVPSCHAGKDVTIRWNEHLLRIIVSGEQVALPYYIVPRTKTKRRVFKKLKEKVGLENFNQSLQSYLGYLGHASSFKIAQELKNQVWLLTNIRQQAFTT